MDKEILSLQLNIGTKVYYFDLKGNPSGLYVKIVEKRGDRRSNIIVPADKLEEFAAKLAEMRREIDALPPEASDFDRRPDDRHSDRHPDRHPDRHDGRHDDRRRHDDDRD